MLDELTLGKCVDGELTEAEQQQFLKLVEQNDQWRSVALAFLEEQAWGNVLAKPPEVSGNMFVQPAVVRTKSKGASWTTMALGLMVALAAGLLVGDIWRDSVSGRQQNVTAQKPIGPTPVVQDSQSPLQLQQPPMKQRLKPQRTPDSHYVMNVTDANGQQRRIKRPVYDHTDFDDTQNQQPQFTADVEQRLQRMMGLRLERKESTQMMRLPDGTQILVPVRVIRATQIQ